MRPAGKDPRAARESTMRRNRPDTANDVEPRLMTVDEAQRATHGWIPASKVPQVGLDPAVWSQRVHQVALWKLLDAWNTGRRLH